LTTNHPHDHSIDPTPGTGRNQADDLATFSIREFCELTGLCRTSVNKLITRLEVKTKKAGRRRLILRNSAVDWLNGAQ
jgi:hypothetical protein